VPRRRFQRGHLFKRGKSPVWVGVFREHQLQADGTIKRVQRKVVLGPVSELSERAAWKRLQPFLDRVNDEVEVPSQQRGLTDVATA
jgi:hypothetical protein